MFGHPAGLLHPMRSGEHAAEFATATRHSAKMRRGDFSAEGRNERQWPTNAASRNLLER
jgi:hypothetical protein